MTAVYSRVYLREEEDEALRAYARDHGSSNNYVVRCGLRLLVGLPVHSSVLRELRARLDDDAGNDPASS